MHSINVSCYHYHMYWLINRLLSCHSSYKLAWFIKALCSSHALDRNTSQSCNVESSMVISDVILVQSLLLLAWTIPLVPNIHTAPSLAPALFWPPTLSWDLPKLAISPAPTTPPTSVQWKDLNHHNHHIFNTVQYKDIKYNALIIFL